jgi:signal transduction histidine kinase
MPKQYRPGLTKRFPFSISDNLKTDNLSKKLEEEFDRDFFDKSIGLIRLGLAAGIALFALFGLLDIWMLPSTKETAWLIRFAIVIPSITAVLGISYWKNFRQYMHSALMLLIIIAGWGIDAMIAASKPFEPGFDNYYVGLILVVICASTLFRLRLKQVLFSSSVIVVGYIYVAIFIQGSLPGARSQLLVANLFFIISATALGLIAAYLVEHFSKRDFLLRKTISEEKGIIMKNSQRLRIKTNELDSLNQRLIEIDRKKNQFLFCIGHELKTPLAVIEMSTEVLQSHKSNGGMKEQSLALIRQNTVRLEQKIEEIIQLSRFEHGAKVEKSDIRLDELLKAAVKTHYDFAKGNNNSISLRGTERPLVVKGDARLIKYAVNNLLSNAVKFTRDGRINVKLEYGVRYATISIADTGQGVPKNEEKRLFRKFFKADSNGPGTGVGLYITKEIARRHGGRIGYKPNKPQGAVFFIKLPMKGGRRHL